ncbi:hypothetical protein Taro_014489 [Colocasia esculenta]|uniref:Transmembrane protein n=1 Tax=Colocasia esculenta TaxID=4460 RepID=A0A843UQA1_COLES|nr:hypothetical protein [Colocasia esculenta]
MRHGYCRDQNATEWLLSALCWVVVNSGEVLPEFFSVGSGGMRVSFSLGLLLCSLKSSAVLPLWFEVSIVWLVAAALLSKLSEACSQDCSGLVSAGCCATSGLRYAVVVLAGAFWWVSQNGALVVLVEVLPEPVLLGLARIVSAVLLAAEWFVFVLGYCCVAPVV